MEEKLYKKLEIELKYFKDKTLIIATHNEKINKICNKFYNFENHYLQEK